MITIDNPFRKSNLHMFPYQLERGARLFPSTRDRGVYGMYNAGQHKQEKKYKGCICFDMDGVLVPFDNSKHKEFYKGIRKELNSKIAQIIEDGYLVAIITYSDRTINMAQVDRELQDFNSFNKQKLDGQKGIIFFSLADGHRPDRKYVDEAEAMVGLSQRDSIYPRSEDIETKGAVHKTAAQLEISDAFNIPPTKIALLDDKPEWLCGDGCGIGARKFIGYVVEPKQRPNSKKDSPYLTVGDLEKVLKLLKKS